MHGAESQAVVAEPVKVGVVGCGDVAHKSYLPALARYRERARVTAVCDADPLRAARAAEIYSVPRSYSDYERFLGESDVAMVVILTRNVDHAAHALAALRAGKHVCCEKLLANRVDEATEIIELARQRGLKLAVAPAVLLDPGVRRAAELIRGGAIGKVCLVRAHSTGPGPASDPKQLGDPTWFYQSGSGALREQGVYPLTTITGLLGPAKRVTALAGIAIPEAPRRRGPVVGGTIRVEAPDNYVVLLDFGAGCFATVDASYCVRAERPAPTEIFGSTGSLNLWSWRHDGHRVELFYENPDLGLGDWIAAAPAGLGREWEYGWTATHLVDCLFDGREIVLTAEHHRHVVEIIEASEISARDGRTIELQTTFEGVTRT
jgi:predicted dehydrogenase